MNHRVLHLLAVCLVFAFSSACSSSADEAAVTSSAEAVPETTGVPTSDIADATAKPETTAPPETTSKSEGEASLPLEEQDAVTLAEALVVDKLAVWLPEFAGFIVVNGSTATTVMTPTSWAFSDGEFVYTSNYDNENQIGVVYNFDGVPLCEVAGEIHHATAKADGSIVVAVDRTTYIEETGAVTPAAAAVDCTTGAEQPIESWRFAVDDETGYGFVERVGDRVFTFHGDVEGNADGFNEVGESINGGDYAGWHTFNNDGAIVVYGDAAPMIHVSASLRARDTTSGEVLWSLELERPFTSLTVVGERLFIGIPEAREDNYYLNDTTPDTVLIVDIATGETIETVPTLFDIFGAS